MEPTLDPVEDALRRYRPSGPPAALRGRVLAQDVPARAWPWAAAAAALLVVTLGLHQSAARIWPPYTWAAAGGSLTDLERRALADAGVDDLTLHLIALERAAEDEAGRVGLRGGRP